jgi:periplasmic protein TonB
MPQEFLRDVLRAGDARGRRQRHWSLLPLSIAAHALVLMAFVLSPWVGEIELPAIASPLPPSYINTVPPPAPPPPRPFDAPSPEPTRAPIAAPDAISPEPEISAPARETVDGGFVTGAPGIANGPLLSEFSAAAAVPLPPPPQPVPKLVRVGGTIREPRKVFHVAPLYPEIARQSRVQGTVVMEAILDATGKVESVRVMRSHPLLDDAAVRAVRLWRYTPTELNGVPVPVLMTVTIRFSLDR